MNPLRGYDNWLTRDFEDAYDRAQRHQALAARKAAALRHDGAALDFALAEFADDHPAAWRAALVAAATAGRLQALDRCIEQAIQQAAEHAAREVTQTD